MHPGEKLPTIRTLAKYLNISRNIIIESYEQLNAEGYIHTLNGSGTYISEGAKFDNLNFTEYSSNIIKGTTSTMKSISFHTGIPDLETVPIRK